MQFNLGAMLNNLSKKNDFQKKNPVQNNNYLSQNMILKKNINSMPSMKKSANLSLTSFSNTNYFNMRKA
tara:strand:+ start:21421 stop:21627 length:207 start_codon:yes stop_codon:yes gene_type:complete